MPETVFRISIDLGHLIPESTPLSREVFPTLAYAVEQVTAAAHQRWQAFASGVPLPDGKVISNRTGEYLRSIQIRSLGDFAGEVFTELPYAAQIEYGAPARDLKKMLNSSLKVRVTKDGRRYLIIPFRWNSPGSVLGNSMPESVAQWWKQEGRESSAVTGRLMRPSGTGAFDIKTRKLIMVPAWRYKWGSRLGAADLESMGFKPGEKLTKRLEGMVNFRTPGATGGASHSKFLNFRVMMEGSKGWVVPAQEGKHPARTTANEIRPVAEEAFAEAVSQDVRRLLAGS